MHSRIHCQESTKELRLKGRRPLKIAIDIDGETYEFCDDQVTEEFDWHNLRDSNHCRRVRRKIFEALLAIAKSNKHA